MTKNLGSDDVKILTTNVQKTRLQQAQSTLKKLLSFNFKKHDITDFTKKLTSETCDSYDCYLY